MHIVLESLKPAGENNHSIKMSVRGRQQANNTKRRKTKEHKASSRCGPVPVHPFQNDIECHDPNTNDGLHVNLHALSHLIGLDHGGNSVFSMDDLAVGKNVWNPIAALVLTLVTEPSENFFFC